VFEALHLEILDRLGRAGRLDWWRASLDSMSVRAKRVGATLAQVRSIAASQAPTVRTPSGRRRARPGKLDADKGYDSAANRAWLRRHGITARIARREIESSTRLGRHRWRVERALSWLSCWRRLQVRWGRDSGRWFASVPLACTLTCFQRL
jgi:IS5 family transposase